MSTNKKAAKKAPAAPAAKEPEVTLATGKYSFSKATALRVYNKTKAHRPVKKSAAKKTGPKSLYVEKPFQGKSIVVRTKKLPSNYPVKSHGKRRPSFRRVVGAPKVRKSLQPGTVLILLAGVHRGKRVVLLKALKSGLLLVTGPFKVNRVPLRRVHQKYVIATSTKLNLEKVTVPENVNDAYFRRLRERRAKKAEGDIFATKKEGYKPSEQRKADQVTVDKQILGALKTHPERKTLLAYLRTPFSLSRGQYPHQLKF